MAESDVTLVNTGYGAAPNGLKLRYELVGAAADAKAAVVATYPLVKTVVAASIGNSQLAVAGTAVALSSSLPAGASYALISVENTNIRWWDDGKVPTATQGMLLTVGSYFWVEDPSTFQMISTGGTATVTVAYYGYK